MIKKLNTVNKILKLTLILSSFTVWFAVSEYLRLPILLIIIASSVAYFNRSKIAIQPNTKAERVFINIFAIIVYLSFIVNYISNPTNKIISNGIMTLIILFIFYYLYSSLIDKFITKEDCIKSLAYSGILLLSIILIDSILVNFAHVKIHDLLCFGYRGNVDYFERTVWTSTAAPTEEPGISGMYLNVLVPFSMFYFKGIKRTYIVISYFFCLFSLFSTTAIFTFITGLALIFFISKASFAKKMLIVLSTAFIILAILSIVNKSVLFDFMNGLSFIEKVTFSGSTESDSDRQGGMTMAIKDGLSSPFLGMGPGYGKAVRETGYLSTFLGFLGMYGLFGFLSFCAFWSIIGYKCFKTNNSIKPYIVFSFYATTVAGIVGDNLHNYGFWMLIPIIVKLHNENKNYRYKTIVFETSIKTCV